MQAGRQAWRPVGGRPHSGRPRSRREDGQHETVRKKKWQTDDGPSQEGKDL
jgi:hypothetical protein